MSLFERERGSAAGGRMGIVGQGITLVEVLTVVVALGTLVRLAVPDLQAMFLEARTTEVVRDVEILREAAARYRTDRETWPPDGYTALTPPGLDEYLPDGFDFEGPGYRLDWEHWTLPDGLPGRPDTRVLVGVSVITTDRGLGVAVSDRLGTAGGGYTLGDQYTFLFDGE